MATDKLVDAFEAARRLGFHDMKERPVHGSRNEREYLRAKNHFRNARLRGHVPLPDVIRGKKIYLWRESTIQRWIELNDFARKVRAMNKKARQRANADELEDNDPSEKEIASRDLMPQRAKKGKRDAVSHG